MGSPILKPSGESAPTTRLLASAGDTPNLGEFSPKGLAPPRRCSVEADNLHLEIIRDAHIE